MESTSSNPRSSHREFGIRIRFRGRGNYSGKIDRDLWIEEGETVTPGRDPEKLLASGPREVVGPVLTGIFFNLLWKFRNLNLSRSWNLESIRRVSRLSTISRISRPLLLLILSRDSWTREPSKKRKKEALRKFLLRIYERFSTCGKI